MKSPCDGCPFNNTTEVCKSCAHDPKKKPQVSITIITIHL